MRWREARRYYQKFTVCGSSQTEPGNIVSSIFFMCLPDKVSRSMSSTSGAQLVTHVAQVLVYGDCAINADPTPEQLAQIAITSAETAKAFGIEPRVAMLSYATGESQIL